MLKTPSRHLAFWNTLNYRVFGPAPLLREDAWLIYTDSSWKTGCSTRCGVGIYQIRNEIEQTTTHKYILGTTAEVFDAELYTVHKAPCLLVKLQHSMRAARISLSSSPLSPILPTPDSSSERRSRPSQRGFARLEQAVFSFSFWQRA